MATVSFQQTDTAVACALAAFCSGLSLSAGTTTAEQAAQGGTAGTATNSPALVKGETNIIAVGFECVVPSGATWAAGNWTVRLNVTTANSNLTWTEVFICRVSSGCASQATIGSNTAVGVVLGTTGVKSAAMSGSAQTPSAGDKVYVVLAFTNAQIHNTQSFSYVANQLIDSPFTVSLTQLLSATSATTAMFTRQTARSLAVTSATTAMFTRQTARLLAAIAATSVTLVRQTIRSLSATAATSAMFVRQAVRSLSAIAATSAMLVRQAARSLFATAATSAVLVRQTSRTLLATAATTAALQAAHIFLQTLLVTVATSATFARQTARLLSVTAATSATFARQTARLLAVTAATSATFARQTARALGATAMTSAAFIRQTARALGATAATSAAMAGSFMGLATLSAAVTSAVTLATQYVAGGGQMAKKVLRQVLSWCYKNRVGHGSGDSSADLWWD